MDLNKKRFKAESGSYLAASLSADEAQFPRVFYQARDDKDRVSMAAFDEGKNKVKDWTVTPLTGVSS